MFPRNFQRKVMLLTSLCRRPRACLGVVSGFNPHSELVPVIKALKCIQMLLQTSMETPSKQKNSDCVPLDAYAVYIRLKGAQNRRTLQHPIS